MAAKRARTVYVEIIRNGELEKVPGSSRRIRVKRGRRLVRDRSTGDHRMTGKKLKIIGGFGVGSQFVVELHPKYPGYYRWPVDC